MRAAEGKLKGLIVVYVDDFIGISVESQAQEDQAILREVVCGTFGKQAINTDKSVLPTQITDCLGWTVDLVRSIVYPNEKGRRKLVSAFFSVDLHGSISQHAFQQMASLASRYSQALIGTRPFVRALYAASKKCEDAHASSETRACIVVWRAIALMAISDPVSLAVPIRSVSSIKVLPQFLPTSDAGPLGLGVVVRNIAGDILAYAKYKLPFSSDGSQESEAKESRFQNVREFLGAIMSMILCYQLARGPCYVHWVNDNTSAIAWVNRNMSKSKAAQFAFLTYTWLGLLSGVHVVDSSHIPGVSMGCVDSLSRFIDTPELPAHLDWSGRLPLDRLDAMFIGCEPVAARESNLVNWEDALLAIIPNVSGVISLWPNPPSIWLG